MSGFVEIEKARDEREAAERIARNEEREQSQLDAVTTEEVEAKHRDYLARRDAAYASAGSAWLKDHSMVVRERLSTAQALFDAAMADPKSTIVALFAVYCDLCDASASFNSAVAFSNNLPYDQRHMGGGRHEPFTFAEIVQLFASNRSTKVGADAGFELQAKYGAAGSKAADKVKE